MSCRNTGKLDWSAPAAVLIEGGSVGFQLGGEETDLIMMVMNQGGEALPISVARFHQKLKDL